ncbi:XVIPCD domain-containing protein [Lysobacter sp. CA199]|uniref:XVIPCD domain-containing protein n=1 Tax=Lysobacter sp. CA199 TaxID=3455608 RepID=UPI003F8D05B5
MATLQEELEARHKLDAMLADFERQARTDTANPGEIFRGVLDSTPELREQYEHAVKGGHLVGLEAETDARFNGSYNGDSRTMRLSVAQLIEADSRLNPEDALSNVNAVRYTAGHEIDHALHREENARLAERFHAQVGAIANGPSPHDFTGPVKEYNEGARVSEARAEISGFNTVAAQVKRDNPQATLADLYEADGGVSNYMHSDHAELPTVTMKPGLHIKPDLQLDAAKSLEAMAKTFYDDHKGYPARNIDWAFGQIYRHEAIAQKAHPDRPFPEIRINVEALGADVKLPPDFRDSSPVRDQQAPPSERPAAPGADDPTNLDHKLLEKIRGSVRDLERSMGKPWDEQSERMSASALSLAVGNKFGPGDDVKITLNRPTDQNAAGELLFVYREGRNASPDPAANYAHMPVEQALSLPATERYAQATTMRETQALDQQREQQLAAQKAQSAEQSQTGPQMQH